MPNAIESNHIDTEWLARRCPRILAQPLLAQERSGLSGLGVVLERAHDPAPCVVHACVFVLRVAVAPAIVAERHRRPVTRGRGRERPGDGRAGPMREVAETRPPDRAWTEFVDPHSQVNRGCREPESGA